MILNQFILLSMLEATKTCVLSYILKNMDAVKIQVLLEKGRTWRVIKNKLFNRLNRN